MPWQMLNEQAFASARVQATRASAAARTMSVTRTIVSAIALLGVATTCCAFGERVGPDWFTTSLGLW